MTDCLFICRRPPYGSCLSKANLDMLLAAASFDQDIALLFIGDGLHQLRSTQQGELIKQKDIAAALKALPLYDVNRIYSNRALRFAEPVCSPEILDQQAVQQLIAEAKVVINL